ncbi:MAG: hypothetical protein AB7L09_26365 [Nitrospira sp.]
MDFDYWKLTTVVLAISAAYIAYQQYRLGREKFKLDLFEKRFAVFSGTRKFLTHILTDGNLKDYNYLWEYRAAIGEAEFLFETDVTEYLEDIYKQALKLKTHSEEMSSLPAGPDRTQLNHELHEALSWLLDQLPQLKIRFSPYMKFKTWKC